MSRQLKVLYPDYPPGVNTNCHRFPELHVSSLCLYPGLMVEVGVLEIIHLLAKETNMTIIPYTIQGLGIQYDYLDTEYDSRIFQLLKNGTVDTIALPMQETKRRQQLYSFTKTIYKVQTRIVKQVSQHPYGKIWAFFETYDKQTWGAFLIVWLLQWVLCLVVHQTEARLFCKSAPSALDTAWKVLKIQLMQFESYESHTLAGKFSMLLFSLLQSTILLGVYGSWILANIIQKEGHDSQKSVANVLQWLNSRDFYFVTNEPEIWFFENVNNSNDYPYAEFRDAFKNNPVRYVKGVKTMLGVIREEQALAYMQDDDRVNFNSRQYCYFEAIRLGMPMIKAHIMFRKNSHIIPLFNRAIQRNSNLLVRLSKKYAEYIKMGRNCGQNKAFKPLSLEPYAGLCAVCLTILVGALGVLFVEIVTSRFGV